MKNNKIEDIRMLLQQYEKRVLSERIKKGIRASKKGKQ